MLSMNNLNLKDIKNYTVYYGYDNFEELSNYDLVIIEPKGQSENNIKYMKINNTLVIGYISVLEIAKDCLEIRYLKNEDFLNINGERLVNDDYNNYIIDLRSKRWRNILIQKIGDLLLNKDFDGIFLDTISDIEFQEIPRELKDSLISAYINLLSDIKELFQECIIIQNNGILELVRYCGFLVDAIVWENPYIDDSHKNNLHYLNVRESTLAYIKLLKSQFHIELFILMNKDYTLNNRELYEMMKNICNEANLLIYEAENNYLE